jgi:hypothetical protein
MILDWWRLDALVHEALKAWRVACEGLRSGSSGEAPSSVPVVWRTPRPLESFAKLLRDPEQLASAEQADDAVARALVPWLRTLQVESWVWDARAAAAEAWNAPRGGAADGLLLSPRERRRAWFTTRAARERRDHAVALSDVAGDVKARELGLFEARSESWGETSPGGVDAALVAAAAERFVARSNDAALAARSLRDVAPGFIEGVPAAFARDAGEGWPARLTARWLGDVFRPSGLLAGLRLAPARLPRVWGASSFALALGEIGVAVQLAARPPALPFSLHQHPFGVRRHARHALFAGLVADETFAVTVLGLGRDRARDQCRRVAGAFLAALRIDALRVLLARALEHGRQDGEEALRELGDTIFGSPPPVALCGVVPQLRPGDAAAFAGALSSQGERARLVAAYDEDWFRNPRAAEDLRHLDAAPRAAEPTAEALTQAVDDLVQSVEALLG